MQVDVAVVGAGPAGMAAAVEAAEAGASVLMLDEYAKPGGQFFKRAGDGFSVGRARLTREHDRGEALRQKLSHPRIRVQSSALVWGRFDDTLMIYRESHTEAVPRESSRDRDRRLRPSCGVSGVDSPGVISAGGAQTLAKTQWVKPGHRMLLAGAGPFLLPVAQSLLRAGVRIAAIVEATKPAQWLRHAGSLWGQWPRFAEAWDYKRELRRAGAPAIYGHKIVRALGERKVEAAVIAKVDRDWHAIPGTERTIAVDGIATGYGFLPNIELAASCGCDLRYDEFARAWFVRCDQTMATNVPGVFVAGEITGIGGSAVALAEGRIAGIVGRRTRRRPVAEPGRGATPNPHARPGTPQPLCRRAERTVRPARRPMGISRRRDDDLPLRGSDRRCDCGMHCGGMREHEGHQGLDARRHGAVPGSHVPQYGERAHRRASQGRSCDTFRFRTYVHR